MDNKLSRLLRTKAQSPDDQEEVKLSFLWPDASFPLVIRPNYAGLILGEWMKGNQASFDRQIGQHGAILFRGFRIDTVDRFQDFMKGFEGVPQPYKQRSSPRIEVAKNIYHSTTYPADQRINMHSENSYAYHIARKIIFCCIRPAEEGGETPIADNRMVLNRLSDQLKEKFRTSGVLYRRNIDKNVGLPWQEVFQTKDRATAERECRAEGITYRWENEDRLVLSWVNKAICDHPDTGEPVWFNHSFFFNKYAMEDEVLESFRSENELPFNTFFGDGKEISRAEIAEIRSAYEQATVMFPWEQGDVLFLDNMIMSHGRNPYKGERQIVVSLL